MKSTIHENQENKLQILSKNFKQFGLLATALITMASCSKNDEPAVQPAEVTPATAAQFASVRETALQDLTQNFTATAGVTEIILTSAKGVKIKINSGNLTKNGNPITGTFDVKFIEIFDKGHMLSTNKSTMGKMPDGNQSIMKSGGEFYLNATQGGVQLATNGAIGTLKLEVPATLTGAIDPLMTFWTGVTADPENIVWERKDGGQVGFNQVPTTGTSGYNVTFGNFGWSNIDRLYNLPGVKTQILATVPAGFNETNCAIYFSLDGEGTNQLAKFDVYNPTTMQFSEHYGQVPIGQACHLIFASAEGSQWRYAVKGISVSTTPTNFTLAETIVGSEAQMVAAINAIQ
jgi:hypothetical protein